MRRGADNRQRDHDAGDQTASDVSQLNETLVCRLMLDEVVPGCGRVFDRAVVCHRKASRLRSPQWPGLSANVAEGQRRGTNLTSVSTTRLCWRGGLAPPSPQAPPA